MTNLYAEQFIGKEQGNLRPHFLVQQWKPTDRGEMLSQLGIMIIMGLLHKPRFSMYWSTDALLSTPIFRQSMARDIFLCVNHFYTLMIIQIIIQLIQTETDSINSGKSLIWVKHSTEVYLPGKNLTVDETLVFSNTSS